VYIVTLIIDREHGKDVLAVAQRLGQLSRSESKLKKIEKNKIKNKSTGDN
jgi:hypothetical protein